MFKAVIDYIKELNNGRPFIPLHEPTFAGNEKKYLLDCIDTGFVSSVGEYVTKFEKALAEYTGAKRAVVVVNGTEALHLALVVVGVNDTHEVITQPLSFAATVNAISYTGAAPVFVDVDRDTMGLSPDSLLEFLEKNTSIENGQCINKKTRKQIKACVPMHTFGHPARIEALAAICEKYQIVLIEDAAESIGSSYKNKATGRFGKIGTLSFNGNKVITTGGGGALITDDEALADYAKHLSTQAKIPHAWEYAHDHIGYNYRMPNLNAALGLAQLEQLNFFIEKKRELYEKYAAHFSSLGVEVFREPKDSFSNYWLNAVVLKDRTERELFLKETNEAGVMTRPIWNLLYKSEMFASCQRGDTSNAEWLEDRIVNIPSSVLHG